ncbi:MAG: peptidoglycan DD-metalloendopeptidase family protein [Patescibacteria group bacterium]
MQKIKRFLIKFLLTVLKGSLKLKEGIIFVLRILEKPLSPFGAFIYKALFFFYKMYFSSKRFVIKIIPAKNLLALATNKYFVHAAIVIIAMGTVSQNLYARTGSLGDYGKNSILFKLTKPVDGQDETVEGLPINSDIELDTGIGSEAQPAANNIVLMQPETFNVLGYIGGDQAPVVNTESTRTSIEYYIVQSGDTLSTISDIFGIDLNTLLWANNLSSRSTIRPGDKLAILPIDGVSHTVKKGETLASIAKKYKGDVEKIKEFNHLADSGLSVGQVLIVPGGAITPVATPPPAYSSGYTTSKTYVSSGALLWPVPSHRVTQYFSWKHPGLDVGLPTGSNIVAAEAGTVLYSGWGTGYGYEVLIDHGNGLRTRYAHASRLSVKKGDQVERGQVIALSGNTGWSTGPHLHFEVYSGSTRQNPLSYIK